MTTVQDVPAVRAYLDELRRALAGRPAEERDLVLDGVRQHVEDALGDGTAADPAAVRRVLDDLGDPAAIAAESAGDVPAVAAPAAPASAVPFLERRSGVVVVSLLVAIGGVLVPVLGWIAGVGLLWASRSWTVRDKVVGTAVPFVLTAVLLGIALLIGQRAGISFSHLALLLGPIAGGVAAGAFLLRRARPAA